MRATGWTRGLLMLSFGGVLMAGSIMALLFSPEAGAETQQTGTSRSNPTTRTTQAGQAPKITPEQEAVLVEVRKILKEAREVATAIQVPSRFLTNRHRVKALEQMKTQLLDDIDKARLRAGDFSAAGTTKHIDLLALAQAAYGKTQNAVQTTSRPRIVDGNPLLILVDILTRSGDVSAAMKAVDATLTKGVTPWDHAQRVRYRAEALALIAQRQHERNDPAASTILQQAVAAAHDVLTPPEEVYWAFLHVGRVQGMLGDRAGSVESFRQALNAAKGRRNEEPTSGKLLWIAKAQAEAGDAVASQQTFQQAIQVRKGYGDLTCLAWAQDTTGNHEAAARSLKLAVDDAERLPLDEQKKGLPYIVPWQMKINDREAAVATIGKLRKMGELVNASVLASRFGFLDTAMAIADETPKTDEEKASWLRVFAQRLIETRSPLGTMEKLKQLSQEATLLRNRLPKDRSKSEWMLAHIAVVQAASDDLVNSRQTIKQMADGPQLSFAYEWIVDLFVQKGDLTTAAQIASEMNEDRRPFTSMFKSLGRAYGRLGEVAAGLAWARQQQNPYAKTKFLLGVAEGRMKAQGIKAMGRPDHDRLNRCPDVTVYDER